jgi:hypothetical protein
VRTQNILDKVRVLNFSAYLRQSQRRSYDDRLGIYPGQWKLTGRLEVQPLEDFGDNRVILKWILV